MNEKPKQKGWKRFLKIFGIVVGSIVAAALIAVAAFPVVIHIQCHEYYSASTKEVPMPGISDGIIIQGIDYDVPSEKFFFCGYSSGSDPSRVYTVDKSNKETHYVNLAEEDGGVFDGHAGGLAVHGDYVYLAGSSAGCVYVWNRSAILNAKDGDFVSCLGSYSLKTENDKIRVSFVGIIENRLTVGEFYVSESSYNTVASHHVETADGIQGGIAVSIDFSDAADSVFGLSPNISRAFSLPKKCQGVISQGDSFYASCSQGMSGNILHYKMSEAETRSGFEILGQSVPLTILDSRSLVKNLKVAPMCEEIVIVDNRMYIACESASSKYVYGKLLGASKLYSTDLTVFG